MYQINDYRCSGRTSRLLSICREEKAVFISDYPEIAKIRGFSDIEVMSYGEALKNGLPKDKPYVIDDLDYFVTYAFSGGKMIGYSIQKPIPYEIETRLNK